MRLLYTAVDWMPYGTPASYWGWFRTPADTAGILASEYRRAAAAERRYQELRCMDRTALVRVGVASADIAVRVFDEFYGHKGVYGDKGGGSA